MHETVMTVHHLAKAPRAVTSVSHPWKVREWGFVRKRLIPHKNKNEPIFFPAGPGPETQTLRFGRNIGRNTLSVSVIFQTMSDTA
ncbi:hypothetical protein ATPR_3240 [Acetobacter tropicalis NBRC 101654]|uniref:Uncharacterized protein n=1 Tax=Acetobacter tropicalis NBRC 101654 TaxID=749388 RepID=F7VIP1_9PROT|nr:hypothetical protein ATPR_3240 [Acetobacter tropicalis NBRC 101654]